MLNFHYLSLSKIDMFYGQLSGRRMRATGALGLNLGFLQGEVGLAAAGDEPTVYEKLVRVVQQLTEGNPPGTLLDDDSTFVRDRLDLSAVVVATDPSPGGRAETQTVLFAGRSDLGTPVVLGGSAEHMGPRPAPAEGVSSSFYYLQNTVQRLSEEWKDLASFDIEPVGLSPDDDDDDGNYDSRHNQDESWHRSCIRHLAELAVQGDRRFQPLGYCEFLALRAPDNEPLLPYGYGEPVLLTPLYVVQMEREERPRQALRDRW